MSRRRVYAELEPDEYGNRPDIRFLPHLFKHKGGHATRPNLRCSALCRRVPRRLRGQPLHPAQLGHARNADVPLATRLRRDAVESDWLGGCAALHRHAVSYARRPGATRQPARGGQGHAAGAGARAARGSAHEQTHGPGACCARCRAVRAAALTFRYSGFCVDGAWVYHLRARRVRVAGGSCSQPSELADARRLLLHAASVLCVQGVRRVQLRRHPRRGLRRLHWVLRAAGCCQAFFALCALRTTKISVKACLHATCRY